jgi:Zn-dependent metalloprotease
MKKNYYLQLLFVFALSLPINLLGQVNNEVSRAYHKNMKFTSSLTIVEAKENFINEFGLDESNTFVEYQTNTDKTGGLHQKFQQYYKGVKVEYGTMIVHSKNGIVTSINGELYNPVGLNLTSSLSSESALQKAISQVGAKNYLWNNAEMAKSIQYKKPEGDLIIFPVIGKNEITLSLAYKFDIYATEPVSRGYVYIDANNGGFLYNEPIIKHFNNTIKKISKAPIVIDKTKRSKTNLMVSGTADTRYSGTRTIETRAEVGGFYTLNDDSRNVHTYNAQNSPTNGTYQFTTVDFEDNDNNWTAAEFDNTARDNAALDAHWGAMKVYDYWANLGRNSYNDTGAEIRSYVHVGTDYFNAYWNGSVMSYGDGSPNPLTPIDIVSHEIAHAVTTWTADLVYARESGAMNEGFSDIFGAAVEYFAKGTGTDANPNAETWLLGEDINYIIRSMSDPNIYGDPDTYNGQNYTDATSSCIPSSSNDYCGVHSNSGVLNHWFYILVSGKAGTNNAGDTYNVTGIGMSKAQEIAYLTLRDYLSPNSTFIDARNGAVEVASSLYGSNSAERKATQDAFYAVNVGDNAFIPFATDIKLVEFSDLVDITCGESIAPKIKVRNSGASNTISTIQVNYTIEGVAQTPFTWNGTLAVDGETEITLPTINETTIKSYNLVVETVVTGDGDSSNNSISSTFRVNREDNTPTEVNTFDNFLVDYWLTYNEGGGNNLWAIGAPNKTNLNSVTSGLNAYVTGTTANYPNETKSYLISPCYDLTTMNNPKLKFNMAFELEENFDIIYVEYSIDAINWTLLGSATDLNWYNSDRIFESGEIASDCQNCPGAQWTGSSNAFIQYSYDLSAFTSEPKINFRFVFHSNASGNDEGVVIDDFVIEEASLAVNDFDLLSQSISIYPNPSKDVFTISWDSGSDIDIELFDLTGKKILSKKNIVGRSNKHELDMSKFSKGFYFAKITIGEGSVTKKVILQ